MRYRSMGHLVFGVVLVALAPACGAEPQSDGPDERPPRSLLIGMIGTPVFRPSERVAQALSADALETVFRSDASPETVASWYRTVLIRGGWNILGDARLPDSSIALHAEQEGKPPIWITIRPGSPAGTSRFSIIGAAPDTTSDDTASSGS